jgi:L-lactate dehydrogenase complex protein LldG
VILGRIRRALAEAGPVAPVPRDHLAVHGSRTPAERTELLARNLAEYRARVHRCDTEAGVAPLVGRLLAERGARRVVVPPGLPPRWLPTGGPARIEDRAGDTARELDRAADSVVTGCALAVAETGTIVLDGGPGQGRRRITLIPDHHVCVVRAPAQIVDSVPHALARLDPARPLTWISGPSATSDIELDRVEGVHGPRILDVILLAAQ